MQFSTLYSISIAQITLNFVYSDNMKGEISEIHKEHVIFEVAYKIIPLSTTLDLSIQLNSLIDIFITIYLD